MRWATMVCGQALVCFPYAYRLGACRMSYQLFAHYIRIPVDLELPACLHSFCLTFFFSFPLWREKKMGHATPKIYSTAIWTVQTVRVEHERNLMCYCFTLARICTCMCHCLTLVHTRKGMFHRSGRVMFNCLPNLVCCNLFRFSFVLPSPFPPRRAAERFSAMSPRAIRFTFVFERQFGYIHSLLLIYFLFCFLFFSFLFEQKNGGEHQDIKSTAH